VWLTAQAGSLKENQSGANGSASFTVPAGTYSLKLKKGGMLYQEVIQVQGASQTCNVPMSTVTVNIPSIPGVMVRLSAGGSASLSASGVTGQAVFAVFQNQEFRLSVTKDAMAHKADISCGTEAVVYDVPVCRIIANFPGMKASLLEAKFGGERVASKRNISDTGDLYVFQNTPYDVSLEIGGNAFSYQGLDCRVNELVLGDATLTVSFPRVKSVNAVRLVGGKTYSQAYKDNSATFSVPNGVYQLLVREGGMEHTATAYVVASSVYNVPMTTLTVNFAGVCAQNMAVLVDGAW